MFFSTSSFASSYELTIDKIMCVKCAQKIHDYFEKNYGQRVQNLKVDIEHSKVTFESISIDEIAQKSIEDDLKSMNFRVVETKKISAAEPEKSKT